jgi:hypothetical protein
MCSVQPIALLAPPRLLCSEFPDPTLIVLAISASNQSSDMGGNCAHIILQIAEYDRPPVFSGDKESLLSSQFRGPVFCNQSRGSVPVMRALLTFA